MSTPILIPVSPQAQNPAKRTPNSVPSSPTSKNPALRSSKGSFSAAPSPRRASSSAHAHGHNCACACAHGAASVLQAQYNNSKPPCGHRGAGFSLVEHTGALFSRPVLWVAVLLFSNYMGHLNPFLWSPQDRAALLAAFTHGPRSSAPVHSSPKLHAHGRALRETPLMPPAEDTEPGTRAGEGGEEAGDQDTPQDVADAAAAAAAAAVAVAASADLKASPSSSASASASGRPSVSTPSSISMVSLEDDPGEMGISDEALLRNDPSATEDTTNVLSLIQAGEQEADREQDQRGADIREAVVGPTPQVGARSSPYVHPWAISLPTQRSCRKIYPRHLLKANQGPITYVGDLLRKHQRLLLSIPRHGLGNSLRGYVSSFVYAALSGRRLVRFHGAEHAKVFDTLCHSFECGFEGMESDDAPGGAMGLYKQLEMLNPVDLNSKFKTSPQVLTSLRSTWTLFVTKSPHFFDGFWHNFPQVRQCIYDAFGCSSAWCVRSRAMQALVGPPTPLLEDVINKVLRKHVGAGKPDVPAMRDIHDMFDIALHFRTRPAAIENKHPGGEMRQALMKIGCGAQESDEASQYLKSCLWDCLGGIIEKLDAKRVEKGRPLQILLATDNEQLRPAFVERLAEYGTVYYSSGVIVHSSKSASEEAERLPTMAEFHLMSRSHTILEAGSYISTFAYFSGLLGNGTLAGIDWRPNGECGLKHIHRGELRKVQHGSL